MEGFIKVVGLERLFDRNMVWSKGMVRVGWKILMDDEFVIIMKEDWEEDMKCVKV